MIKDELKNVVVEQVEPIDDELVELLKQVKKKEILIADYYKFNWVGVLQTQDEIWTEYKNLLRKLFTLEAQKGVTIC